MSIAHPSLHGLRRTRGALREHLDTLWEAALQQGVEDEMQLIFYELETALKEVERLRKRQEALNWEQYLQRG